MKLLLAWTAFLVIILFVNQNYNPLNRMRDLHSHNFIESFIGTYTQAGSYKFAIIEESKYSGRRVHSALAP